MPEPAHVRNNPLLVREPLSTQRDQRRRAIYPRHANSMGHNITCDRHTPATSEVEDTCTFGQQSNEAVMPFLVVPTAASPIGIPFGSVTLVVGDYLIGEVNHSAELGSLTGACKGSQVFERGRRSDTGTVLPLTPQLRTCSGSSDRFTLSARRRHYSIASSAPARGFAIMQAIR